MISIAICDDEKYYREQVNYLITSYLDEFQMNCDIDTFSSGKEFYEKGLDIVKYDIAFLDINMDEITGIDIANRIRSYNSDTYIVFVTNFTNYAIEGYKVDAVRYIIKDTLKVSIKECMDTIINKMEIQMRKMEISFIEEEKQVYIDKIIYIESQKHKLIFYILESSIQTYTIYDKLDNFEEKLNEYGFLRIHKSYLVNMKYIEKVSNYKAFLTSGKELSIPKSRYKWVKEAFVLYRGEL